MFRIAGKLSSELVVSTYRCHEWSCSVLTSRTVASGKGLAKQLAHVFFLLRVPFFFSPRLFWTCLMLTQQRKQDDVVITDLTQDNTPPHRAHTPQFLLDFAHHSGHTTQHTHVSHHNSPQHNTPHTHTHTHFFSSNFGCVLLTHHKLLIALGDRFWRRRLRNGCHFSGRQRARKLPNPYRGVPLCVFLYASLCCGSATAGPTRCGLVGWVVLW